MVTTPRSVAFIGGGFDRGIIRIGQNQNTVFSLDDAPAAVAANTTAQADLAAYAAHVATTIATQNYTTFHRAPSEPILTAHFDTGRHDLRSDDMDQLRLLAQFVTAVNMPITLQGFADRQRFEGMSDSGNRAANITLGNNRAQEVKIS